MRRLLKPLALALMVGGLVLASASLVLAIDITNIDGDWSHAVGGQNVIMSNDTTTYSTGDTATASWGDVYGRSSYVFVSAATPFTANTTGTPFALGAFTHNNYPISSGTAISSIDLDLSLGITGLSTLSTTFLFNHNETPNSHYPTSNPLNDDIVTILNPILDASFISGGNTYYFNLIGFSQDGGDTISTVFNTVESMSNTATLYGEITSRPINPVPEPSTILLLGAGLLGVGCLRRKFNK